MLDKSATSCCLVLTCSPVDSNSYAVGVVLKQEGRVLPRVLTCREIYPSSIVKTLNEQTYTWTPCDLRPSSRDLCKTNPVILSSLGFT